MAFQYPCPRRDENVVDDYHGSKICDPYRWMEDPDSEETKKFVDEENAVTNPFLKKCSIRDKLTSTITQMWDYPKYSCPMQYGGRYYYFHNTGLQNQSVLYKQETITAEPVEFFDPNKLSDDGTVALRGYAFSEAGKTFAYGLSSKGSDWVTIKFKDCETGKDLPDTLERVKFSSMAWTHDEKGLFYNCYPKQEGKVDGTETTSNVHQKLYYHVLGSDPKDDNLCAEYLDEPKWMASVEVSDCGNYLVNMIREGCDPVNRLSICNLSELSDGIKGLLPFVKIIDNFDAEYEYVTNEGTLFTFKTNKNASNYKVIQIPINNSSEEFWKELVAEDEKDVLDWASCVNEDKLVLCYLQDVKSVLYMHDLNSGKRIKTFDVPIGSIIGYSGKKKDTEIFYHFMSFLTPGIIYRCDVTTSSLDSETFRAIKVKNFDADKFVINQIFYSSKDGTKVPMFLIHKKDIELNGSHPVLLYGYGGFNISITPVFSVSRTVFIGSLGGVVAVPNIRGGGEYGEKWHKGGTFGNKQNVFDDFQCAAEYLIEKKYTNAKKIIIQGGSNGGLLVGACINQRPDLFGCAISQVGVMDMLRFHKFTIGHAWTTDFGCSDKKEDCEWLLKYSPLHNIRDVDKDGVQYPATLLLTADHDDRVVPSHSLKFIAQLQHVAGKAAAQSNPIMIQVDTKAGHGAGKPTAKIIEELTDIYSFIVLNLDLKWQE